MSNEPAQHCTWHEDIDGYWESDCGRNFEFVEQGPLINGFNFCPYCGQALMEHPCQGEAT